MLLTIEDYHRLTQTSTSLVELLAMPQAGEIPFQPVPAGVLYRPAYFL